MPEVLPCPRTCPFTRTVTSSACGSAISSAVTIQGPRLLLPSKSLPFAGPVPTPLRSSFMSCARSEKSLKTT
ncbi:hypothetical protein D9M72_528780 [compost metagenome]